MSPSRHDVAHSPAEPARDLTSPGPPAPVLTPRERLILGTLDEDRTLAEIAAGLFVSRNTVKTQVQSLYRKLGVSRRADAVAAAHDLQLS